jgi:hypothetical protein
MALLEDLRPGVLVKGLLPAGNVTVAITEMPLGIARLDELSQTITPTVGRCPTNVAQPQVDRKGQPYSTRYDTAHRVCDGWGRIWG